MAAITKLYFLFVILFYGYLTKISAKPNHLIFLDSINCTVNPAYGYTPNCSVDKTVSPYRGYIDMQMHRAVKSMQFELKIVSTVDNKQRTLMHVKNKDSCAYFEGRVTAMVKTFKTVMEGMGNLPKKCPVDKDFRYLYKSIVIDSSKLPPYIFNTNFEITTRNTAGKDFVLLVQFKGRIRRNVDITVKDKV